MSTFSPPATIASNLMGGSGTDPGNISEVGFDDEVRIVALERFKPLKKDEVARFASLHKPVRRAPCAICLHCPAL